ncbi:MAG: ribonuclease III [Alphaproteobacteria bacterium]
MSKAAHDEALSHALGHRFARPELLDEALTHTSSTGGGGLHPFGYERLEFLGDRVLGLVIAEMLLSQFPREDEGKIARRYSALVRTEALTGVAECIELGRYLALGASEEDSGGRANPGLLADACEAVIAALYLDGGLEVAERFIHHHWKPLAAATGEPPRDAKTHLQEWAQERGLDLPVYETVAREGPPHRPTFFVRASVGDLVPAEGQGASKRAAEQRAAEVLIKAIAGNDDR